MTYDHDRYMFEDYKDLIYGNAYRFKAEVRANQDHEKWKYYEINGTEYSGEDYATALDKSSENASKVTVAYEHDRQMYKNRTIYRSYVQAIFILSKKP